MTTRVTETRSPMTRKPLRLLIALACSTPLNAVALGVGQIQVRSALNQVFDAEIPLLLAGPGEAAGITARLAPAQTFAQKGIDRLPLLSNLVFTVQTGADGRGLIKVTSKQPIREPMLNFLIQVDWPRGQVVREVAVLLDPPVKAKQRPVPAIPTLAQPAAPRLSPPRRTAAVTPEQPAPPPVAHRGAATYGPVPFGETLWAIASRVRPDPSVSVQRMMQALLEANPRGFWKPTVNGLRAGVNLRIPSAQEIDPQRFPEQVSRQLASRQQVPVAPVTPKPEAPPPESKPKVRLVSPEPAERLQQPQPAAPAALPERVTLAPTGAPSFPIKLKDNHPALRVAGLDELRRRMNAPSSGEGMGAATRPSAAAIPPAETLQPRPEVQSPPGASSSQPEPRLQEILPETMAPPGTSRETGAGPTVTPTATPPAAVRPAGTTPPPTPEVSPPAPVTAAAPVPSPAPAPPSQTLARPFLPEAESETSGILSGWLNPASLALLGGLVLLLGGGSWYWWRRRLRAEEGKEEALAFEDVIPVETKTAPGPMSGASDLAAGKEAAPVTEHRTTRTVPNPLERADLLLAVGNYAEAENLLRQGLREEPDNNALRVKLLDVHFADHDAEAFLQEAKALHERLEDKTDPLWLPVAQMGHKLYPGHELFSKVDELLIATKTIKADLAELGIPAKPDGIRPDSPANEQADTTLFSTLNEPTLVSDEQQRDNLAGLDWQLADVDKLTITAGSFAEPPTQPRTRPEREREREREREQAGADLDRLTITAGFFSEPPTQPRTRPGQEQEPEREREREQAGAEVDKNKLTITPEPFPEPLTQPTTRVEKTRVERELEWRLMDLEQPPLNKQSLPGREEEKEKSTALSSSGMDLEIDSLFANEITHSRLPLVAVKGEVEGKATTPGPVRKPTGSLRESSRKRDAVQANRSEESPTKGAIRTLMGEDYTETKLDLAMAYLEMGDTVGARSLLEEVLQDGNEDQQQRARMSMEKIGRL